VKPVPLAADELKWLLSSIKGRALNLVKHYTLDNDSYVLALNKLKARYLNAEVGKHTLLQGIFNFKCDGGSFARVET